MKRIRWDNHFFNTTSLTCCLTLQLFQVDKAFKVNGHKHTPTYTHTDTHTQSLTHTVSNYLFADEKKYSGTTEIKKLIKIALIKQIKISMA